MRPAPKPAAQASRRSVPWTLRGLLPWLELAAAGGILFGTAVRRRRDGRGVLLAGRG